MWLVELSQLTKTTTDKECKLDKNFEVAHPIDINKKAKSNEDNIKYQQYMHFVLLTLCALMCINV